MRVCPSCNSKMELKLKVAKEHPFVDSYFWGCAEHPICDFTINTLLTKKSKQSRYLELLDYMDDPYPYRSNSLKERCPNDQISDSQRHYAIHNQYDYEHKFTKTEIDNLETALGFENQEDFLFWISTQERIVDYGVHNHFRVASPYYFTFQNLIRGTNSHLNNILKSISKDHDESITDAIR